MILFWTIFFFLLGLVVLIKGADIFVDGSAGLARKLRIPDFIIGVTLVAFGTSLPEFIVSLMAGFSKSGELVIGNIVGSNIANIALILGICGIMKTIRIQSETLMKRAIPFMIMSSIILFILVFDQVFQNHGVTFNRLTMGDGLILLSFFVIFLLYIFNDLKRNRFLESEIKKKEVYVKESTSKLAFMLLGGLIAVVGGGKLIVDNTIELASLLGISQGVIGLTIISIGTSLPEAVTTIVAVRKNKEEMAIGNIIGSNTLNILFILGVVATVAPLELSPVMMIDVLIMIIISIILFLLGYFHKSLGKYMGMTFIGFYSVYMLFVVIRESVIQ